MPGEHSANLETLEFSQEPDRDPEKRELKSQVEDLKRSMGVMQTELAMSEAARAAMGTENSELSHINQFLINHTNNLTSQVQESGAQILNLEVENQHLPYMKNV